MRWHELTRPLRMERVAVVAPRNRLRSVLLEVANAGVVELEVLGDVRPGPATEALQKARQAGADASRASPLLDDQPREPGDYLDSGRIDLLAGEAELERIVSSAVRDDRVAALAGWCPSKAADELSSALETLGGALVQLPAPRGESPPTLLAPPAPAAAFQPLVDTYATVPYADLDPSLFAGLTYVAMFGMMFGDVGHGALLLAVGLALRYARSDRLAGLRWAAPFVLGGAIASIVFGLLYGEAFGPTHLVPVLWLAPLDHPTTLLAVAVAIGSVLLAVAYALGTVNRWREGGLAQALVATTGIAGAGLYLGLGMAAAGWYLHVIALGLCGGLVAVTALVLSFVGLLAAAGGGASGAIEASVELFDSVLRVGVNTISFARLAAFGLTHAALESIVWRGTTLLWQRGPGWWAGAILVFVVGNAIAFGLEALVAGVQALRLDYYELFSRIFVSEGRPFRPWRVPTIRAKEAQCSSG
jgi:V/A-type H+-transporting ATPase subunit I